MIKRRDAALSDVAAAAAAAEAATGRWPKPSLPDMNTSKCRPYLFLGSRELFLNVAGHFPRSQPLPQIQLSHLGAFLSLGAGDKGIKARTFGPLLRSLTQNHKCPKME